MSITTLSHFNNYGQFPPQAEYPGDYCCRLYQGMYFTGNSEKLCHDGVESTNYNKSMEDSAIQFNNRTSSFMCGKHTWFNFVKDKNHNTQAEVLQYNRVMSGAGNTKNNNINIYDWTDTLSRVQLGYYDALTMGAVNVYNSYGCDGPSARLYYNPDDIDGGQWNLGDMQKMGLASDTASSIQVPEGYTAYLYGGSGFNNFKRAIVGQYANWDTQELQCISLKDMNDTLGSVIVKRTAPAIGYWQAITSTESQAYKLHVGINYAQSDATAREIQTTLNLGMEMGIDYKIFSGSTSLDYTYSETLRHDVQTTYGLDYSVDVLTTCTTETGEEKDGAGLYQWIVSTSDYEYQAFTWHTVCKTGEQWNIEPACPWYSCVDAKCETCNTEWEETD